MGTDLSASSAIWNRAGGRSRLLRNRPHPPEFRPQCLWRAHPQGNCLAPRVRLLTPQRPPRLHLPWPRHGAQDSHRGRSARRTTDRGSRRLRRYTLLRRPAIAPFFNFSITQLTNTGKVLNAAISPDGRFLLSVQSDNGNESQWSAKHSYRAVTPKRFPHRGNRSLRSSSLPTATLSIFERRRVAQGV